MHTLDTRNLSETLEVDGDVHGPQNADCETGRQPQRYPPTIPSLKAYCFRDRISLRPRRPFGAPVEALLAVFLTYFAGEARLSWFRSMRK